MFQPDTENDAPTGTTPDAGTNQHHGTEITADRMTTVYGGKVVAIAIYREHAAADGGAWVVSTYPARLFSYNDAITALTIAERLAAGYGDDDAFVKSWRAEIGVTA